MFVVAVLALLMPRAVFAAGPEEGKITNDDGVPDLDDQLPFDRDNDDLPDRLDPSLVENSGQ